ncbi:MAG: CDP-glycerol glycerophosphotransferase family protein [Lachnospiraceae bacterium]|nr:CDP-glycerol glycerophosphotransferase family protein [Lachnospiraceae bacterium]
MIKKLGYYVFAAFFALFRCFPIREEKVFFIATHDDSDEGNMGLIAKVIKQEMPEKRLYFLTKRDGIQHPFSFFLGKAYHMATAGTIFLDNIFMPMAYTPVSKKAKVVQLWHGTGTIKRFGLDSDTGEVARLAKKANQRITHLIVNSEKTKKQYAGAFGVPLERVYILGLPRTDLILDVGEMEAKRRKFYEKYPELQGKRCTLYAPTFRDNEVAQPKVMLDLTSFTKTMGEEDVLLLRLHPHVAENFSGEILEQYTGKVVNLSDYPGVTTLLAVSACLITDYSSIVFEYCLFDRPMIFYAYDLKEFQRDGRSFYDDYSSFVPGPVAENQKELEQLWEQGFDYESRVKMFREDAYKFLDKNAIRRLFKLIFA